MFYSFQKNKFKKIVIFLFLFSIFFLNAEAATLGISPASGTYQVGDRVTLKILVNSDTVVNSVSGALQFDSSIFNVDSVSKSNSIINFWVTEPSISHSQSTITFEGVTLNGFSGSNNTILSIGLTAKKVGTGNFSFKNAQVLANDGIGTDVLKQKNTSSLVIVPVKIVEPTVPVVPSIPVKAIPVETEKKSIEDESDIEKVQEGTLNCDVHSLSENCDSYIKINTAQESNQYIIFGESNFFEKNILLVFTPESGASFSVIVKTNDYGNFVSTVFNRLVSDNYKISAQSISDNLELNTVKSNELSIKLDKKGNNSITLRTDLLILFACLIMLTSTLFILKKRKLKRSYTRKIKASGGFEDEKN